MLAFFAVYNIDTKQGGGLVGVQESIALRSLEIRCKDPALLSYDRGGGESNKVMQFVEEKKFGWWSRR